MANEELDIASGEVQTPGKDGDTEKKLIATKVTGTVKWYNVKGRYGFIRRNDTETDVFIHQTAITKFDREKSIPSVGENEELTFDVVLGAKGQEAINVTGVNNQPVKGSTYAPNRSEINRRRVARNSRNQRGQAGPNEENEGGDIGDNFKEPGGGRGGGRRSNRGMSRPFLAEPTNYYNKGGGMPPFNNQGGGPMPRFVSAKGDMASGPPHEYNMYGGNAPRGGGYRRRGGRIMVSSNVGMHQQPHGMQQQPNEMQNMGPRGGGRGRGASRVVSFVPRAGPDGRAVVMNYNGGAVGEAGFMPRGRGGSGYSPRGYFRQTNGGGYRGRGRAPRQVN